MIVNSSNLSHTDLILESHKNVEKHVKPFLDEVNDGNTFKLRDMERIFRSYVWREHKTGNGHCKYEHELTHEITGYPKHNKEISAKVAKAVAGNLKAHVDKLESEEFESKADNSNTPPKPKKVKKNRKYKV